MSVPEPAESVPFRQAYNRHIVCCVGQARSFSCRRFHRSDPVELTTPAERLEAAEVSDELPGETE